MDSIESKQALNADREKTNISIEVPENQDPSKATHVRIDRLNKIFPSSPSYSNTDVYPAEYFKGEWYYAETVVGADIYNSSLLGDNMRAVDTNMALATQIKFIPTQSYLMGVNVNIDERLKDDDINYGKVIQLKVNDWIDKDTTNHDDASPSRPALQKTILE